MPVDAATTERLTYDAVVGRGGAPAETPNGAQWAALFGRWLAAVRVCTLPEELVFVWRA
ncbi:hypothetical protein [Micromonospora sp. CPCC 206061]|uniref:hypothetical protein n=1 Tax=Micromonospora sp. CPCC 206061 TaxID=3122410 RepID=UPI002FF2EDEC